MYGLPQAGMLANKLLKKRLAPHGYYEVPHTPGLWRHQFRPVMFTLVVDDLGVKYVGREHAEHLMNAIEENYTVTKDWAGSLYCGISLKWNYAARHVDISMPKYVAKQLLKFEHDSSHPKQDSPHRAPEIKYGKDSQQLPPEDTGPKLEEDRASRIAQIVGALLYYGRAVDLSILVALSTIAA